VTGGATTPTGTVSITGADNNCSVTLDAGGTGTCNVVFNSSGDNKTLTAAYQGDATHATSVGTEAHKVSAPSPTTTTINTHDPNPSGVGVSIPVFVTVAGGSTTPAGTVNITGADTNCSITLSGGTGSCSVVFNGEGAKTLTASYVGNATHAASSGTAAHSVQVATTTTITSDLPDPSNTNGTVAVNVTVAGGTTIATGNVNITGADTNCQIALVNGGGTCNVIFSSPGAKTITATYGGDAGHAGSVGTTDHQVQTLSSCTVTAEGIGQSANLMSMYMLIRNQSVLNLRIKHVAASWNERGSGNNQKLSLQSVKVELNPTTFWEGNLNAAFSYDPPSASNVNLPANPTAYMVIFTFDRTYDNWNGNPIESISLTVGGPSCTDTIISVSH